MTSRHALLVAAAAFFAATPALAGRRTTASFVKTASSAAIHYTTIGRLQRLSLLAGHLTTWPRGTTTLSGKRGWSWVGPWGVSFRATVTPDAETGLGKVRSEKEIVSAFRTGMRRTAWSSRRRCPGRCTPDDGQARVRVAAYLKSLKPVKHRSTRSHRRRVRGRHDVGSRRRPRGTRRAPRRDVQITTIDHRTENRRPVGPAEENAMKKLGDPRFLAALAAAASRPPLPRQPRRQSTG